MAKYKVEVDKKAIHTSDGRAKLNGRVLIQSTKKIIITDIRVMLFGKSRVSWFGKPKNVRKKLFKYFSEKRNILQEEEYNNVLGPDGTELAPGYHTIPFTVYLPERIPSTFKGKHGYTKYYVDVRIKGPWKFDVHRKIEFDVKELVDVNLESEANVNGIYSMEKKVGHFWWKKSGPVGFDLKVNSTGFTVGDLITFTAELHNFTSKEVHKTKACLIMKIEYRVRGETKKSKNIILATESGPKILAGEQKVWDCSRSGLIIPDTPPTSILERRIIDIQYFLRMAIEVPSFPFGIKIKHDVPIVIGTVGLRDDLNAGSSTTGTDSEFCDSTSYILVREPVFHFVEPNAPPDEDDSDDEPLLTPLRQNYDFVYDPDDDRPPPYAVCWQYPGGMINSE